MKTETKTIEQLQKDSDRMRIVGTASAAVSIGGAILAGLVSAPVAAVLGLAGAAVASVSLLKKLSDERAVAQRTNQTMPDAAAIGR
jgi:hypothetical protein